MSQKGLFPAQKCNFIRKSHSFTQLRTHSSRIHATLMDFWAQLVSKIPFIWKILEQQIIFLGKFLLKIFEAIPFSVISS